MRTRGRTCRSTSPGSASARVLSSRPLQPGTDYLAALVPAFRDDGQPVVERLVGGDRTGCTTPGGSAQRPRQAVFEDLAAALQPGEAPSHTGRAPLDYPRVPSAPDLEVRGALAPVGAGRRASASSDRQ